MLPSAVDPDDPPSEPATAPPETDHYFRPRPGLGSRRRTVSLVLPDLTADLVTDRGVFSTERIDPGTRLLLLEAPPPSPGATNVLDLGCGYGPIARTLMERAPGAHLWAVDVNDRARALTAENLGDRPGVTVCEPHEVPEDVRFDVIWSNPPIRVGKAALHELLSTWLDRLTPDGRAVLVVQRHLGADSLASWLTRQGFAVHRLRSRQGYRLLEVAPRAADEAINRQ